MLSIQRTLLFAVSLFLVQSCSGGGGGDDGGTGGGSGGGTGGGTTPPTDYSVTLGTSAISFSSEYQNYIAESIDVNINYVGDDLIVGFGSDVDPTSPETIYFSYEIKNKTATTATLSVRINDTFVNSNVYSPNLFGTTLRVSAGKTSGTSADLKHAELDVSMLIAQKVKFNGFVGDASIANTSTLISNTTDTWAVSDDADWLTTEIAVNSTSISLTSTTIPTEIAGNSDTATATLTNTTTQETYTIPLAIGLDNIYLFADQPALSFVSTETIQNIGAILNISNNTQRAVAFTATSSNPEWLTVNSSTTQVEVIADTSGLTPDAISEATITVTATTETDVMSDVIPVTAFLSNGEITPFDIDTSGLDINSNAVFVYPAGPYVYAGVGNQINVYNQYTGVLLDEIEVSATGTQLNNFVVHPKGTTLIAQTNEGDTVKRYKINLALADVTSAEITNSEITADPYKFIDIEGRYFIVTNTLEFADEDLQLVSNHENITFTPSSISIASDVNTIFAINDSDSTINRFTVSANDSEESIVTTSLTHSYHPTELAADGAITDIAVTSNENHIYIVSDSSEWITFDATAPVATAFTDKGLLAIDSNLLVIDGSNNIQNLYTPEQSDITTHSVHVDQNNRPYFMRTVQFTSDNATFETHTYKYLTALNSSDDIETTLVTTSFIDTATTLPTEAPYTLDFSLSNNFVVLFNTDENSIKVAPTPFIPAINLLDHAKTQSSNVVFNAELQNISSDWTAFEVDLEADPIAATPWVTKEISAENPQEIIVTLTTATDDLDPGFYERVVYVYDKINKVTTRLKVELSIPDPNPV